MRGVLFTLLAFAVAGCASPPRQWEKPGAGRETAKQDLRDCRRTATTGSWRMYPENVPTRYPSTIYGRHQAGRSDPYFARRDSDRMTGEAQLTRFCMRNKGYELNLAPTELNPTSRPRST